MDDAATPETAPAQGTSVPDPDSAAWNDQVDKALENWEADEAQPENQDEPDTEEAKEADSAEAEDAEAEAEPGGEPAPGEESEPALIEVKVNGETRKVTLDEAAAGYSRLEDYKAKTADLANERREWEAVKAEEWQRLQEASQAVVNGMEADPVIAEWNNADKRDLLEYDPDRYHQLKAAHDERMEWYQGLFAQQQEFVLQSQQQMMEQQQAFARQEADALAQKWPEWGDPAKGVETARALHGYLSEMGFAGDELQGMTDHRLYLVARDAMKWRQHEASLKSAAGKKAPPPTKTAKPKGQGPPRPSQKVSALRNKAFRTGNPRDIADLAENLDWD